MNDFLQHQQVTCDKTFFLSTSTSRNSARSCANIANIKHGKSKKEYILIILVRKGKGIKLAQQTPDVFQYEEEVCLFYQVSSNDILAYQEVNGKTIGPIQANPFANA